MVGEKKRDNYSGRRFNCEKSNLGGEELDQKGGNLMLLTIENGFAIMNDPDSPPTFYSNRGTSWVDVTLGKGKDEWKWEVLDEETLTDHRIIEIIVEIEGVEIKDKERVM